MEKLSKSNISKISSQKFKPFISLNTLPDDLKISTITMTCKVDTKFNLENISRYVDLSQNGIISVKYGKEPECNRNLVPPKTRKKKKITRAFYNQATVVVNPKKGKKVNIKLFLNGSIQMTGCNSLDSCVLGIKTLFSELKKTKAIVDIQTFDKIIMKPFVEDKNELELSKVKNVDIRMINSNFHIGFKVDRENFYKILLNKNIECTYEPIVHACVNIKYNYSDAKKISIFVFESGSIIITGANNSDHIVKAYTFITKELYENYNSIVVNNLDSIMDKPDIMNLINSEVNAVN